MAERTISSYQRLPGLGIPLLWLVLICPPIVFVLARTRLWLGPDHLLLVSATSVGERYKRFPFADIQSCVIRRTASWIVTALVGLAFTLFLLWAAWLISQEAARWAFIGLAILCAVGVLVHLLAGPSCEVTIRTAVQTERLASLGRWRTARRVLARLRPLILAAQENAAPAPRALS